MTEQRKTLMLGGDGASLVLVWDDALLSGDGTAAQAVRIEAHNPNAGNIVFTIQDNVTGWNRAIPFAQGDHTFNLPGNQIYVSYPPLVRDPRLSWWT
jgi:hypothetical protein